MIGIVLHEPEQPGNAGAIGRTCVCTGSSLHLIEPLGFVISDKYLKRAGLDYWPRLDVSRYPDFNSFVLKEFEERKKKHPDARLWYLTTKARQCYSDVLYTPDDMLMFGAESSGIPEEILIAHPERCIRIPMMPDERSINLANSVSIALYEALRQCGFPGMEKCGELHRLHWNA